MAMVWWRDLLGAAGRSEQSAPWREGTHSHKAFHKSQMNGGFGFTALADGKMLNFGGGTFLISLGGKISTDRGNFGGAVEIPRY